MSVSEADLLNSTCSSVVGAPSENAVLGPSSALPSGPQSPWPSGAEDGEAALLREEVRRLRQRNGELERKCMKQDKEVKKLRNMAGETQNSLEAEEEKITKKLLRSLSDLRAEKQRLSEKLRREQTLKDEMNQRLLALKKDKVQLENHLETEQEYIMHKLQKQLITLSQQKKALEKELHKERGTLLQQLQGTVSEMRSEVEMATPPRGGSPTTDSRRKAEAAVASPKGDNPSPMRSPGAKPVRQTMRSGASETEMISQLESEINRLQSLQAEAEQKCARYQDKCEDLTSKMERIRVESLAERHKAHRWREDYRRAAEDISRAEMALEMATDREIMSSISSSQRETPMRSMSPASSVDAGLDSINDGTPRFGSTPTNQGPSVAVPAMLSRTSSAGSTDPTRTLRAHTKEILSSPAPPSPMLAPLPMVSSLLGPGHAGHAESRDVVSRTPPAPEPAPRTATTRGRNRANTESSPAKLQPDHQ